jgi:acetyl-CoA synthetase
MKDDKDIDNTGKANTIEVLLHEERHYAPSERQIKGAHIKGVEEYERLYKESIEDPDGFWARMAEILLWRRPWDKVAECDLVKPDIKWFIGGELNAAENCIDRHLDGARKNKAAIIWEADDGETRTFTYTELAREVGRIANVLKKIGVKKGDVVTIYLPMIPELAFAMLACARIGAIHSVIFGGFSPSSIKDRVNDSSSKFVITADGGFRGGKTVPLKENVDAALKDCPTVERVLVVKRAGIDVEMKEGRDLWLVDELVGVTDDCPAESMDAEDPLFILYTSGSTGKPKGVLHTTGGYMLYSALTFKWIFDYKEEETYFCTADIGWITGHSYIIYGPLACGATTLIFEGIPTYPEPDRFWEIVEKHKVNIFYTAPTAIRALMRFSDDLVTKHDLASLRILGSVGEPINPEAWVWYHKVVGKGKLPVLDTWWQTETGGILISPLPGVATLKPGSAIKPFFGINPKIFKEDGTEAGVDEGGYLVIDGAWPGMLRGTYGDPENKRIKEVYFSRFPGYYFSSDGARKDEDGDFWLMGRIDDVVNVSGHRLGTAEIESALVSHASVSEAAVVGFPHEVKGEGIYAFVTLKEGEGGDISELTKELGVHVKNEISPIAKPDKIQIAMGLPKTRSGKIMRRILRKIASGETDDLGDISTLADPNVVEALVKECL